MRELPHTQLPSSIQQVLHYIRSELYKRIEDDVTEDHWSDASEHDRKIPRQQRMLWRAHVPVESFSSATVYDLYMQIELRPEINRYIVQLFWRRELEGVRQPVVRYENAGRHGNIVGAHLNWNVNETRTEARKAPDVPSDNAALAFAEFCSQPEVNVDFQGQVTFVPAGQEGDS